MPRLTITNGSRAGTEYAFERSVVIGRGGMADLSLTDHTVSRRHALLSLVEGHWHVTDLQTHNGTLLNGARVGEPQPLRDGDRIELGTVVLEYHERPDPDRSAPLLSVVEQGPQHSETVLFRMDAERAAALAPGGGAAAQQLEALRKRVELLSDLAGSLVGQSFDEKALLARIVDKLFELLPQAERAFILLCDEPGGQPLPKVVRTRGVEKAPVAVSRTLLRDVIETRQGVLSQDALGDSRFQAARSMVDLKIRSLVAVPIVAQKDALGVILVDSTRPGNPFSEADMALLFGVARQLGLFLANARLHSRVLEQELLERDLVLARKVQQGFLPRHAPAVPGYAFAAEYSPALAVGGDFYAFLELQDGWLGVAVGDVSGKGVSAALYVARLSSDLRYHSVGETEPAAILKRVNHSLAGTAEEGMFVTATLVTLNPRSGQLKVSSAGHLPPLVREAGGEVVALGEGGGSPLGVAAATLYEQRTYALEPTDIVILYTDGVTEAMDRDHRLFGEERLMAAIQRAPRAPRAMLGAVLGEVRGFMGDEPPNDDLTLVCFGRE